MSWERITKLCCDLCNLRMKAARYLSVYGAMIAAQAREWVREGRGGVTSEAMERFVQEARAVAQLSEDVQP